MGVDANVEAWRVVIAVDAGHAITGNRRVITAPAHAIRRLNDVIYDLTLSTQEEGKLCRNKRSRLHEVKASIAIFDCQISC